MKLKVTSYLKARIRSMSEGKGYRGLVISAMIDADSEFKIGDEVIKGKGELLSLTATEASKSYGDPAQPLLATGVAKDLDALLVRKFGIGGFFTEQLAITWSEKLAAFLHTISPVMLGLGLLALYIEFKTPGFGVFGVTGLTLLAIVFLGNYVAGLSGHEPILLFGLGLVLFVVEVFFLPGVVVMAVVGMVLMLGALVWSMADLWPNEPFTVAWSSDAFVQPIMNLGLGLVIAVALGLAIARFLPRGWLWDRLILSAAVDTAAQMSGGAPTTARKLDEMIGQRGIVVAALRPSGQVEVAGRRFEARADIDAIDVGAEVVVRGRTDFGLVVEKIEA